MKVVYILLILHTEGTMFSKRASAAMTHLEFKSKDACEMSKESFKGRFSTSCHKIMRVEEINNENTK